MTQKIGGDFSYQTPFSSSVPDGSAPANAQQSSDAQATGAAAPGVSALDELLALQGLSPADIAAATANVSSPLGPPRTGVAPDATINQTDAEAFAHALDQIDLTDLGPIFTSFMMQGVQQPADGTAGTTNSESKSIWGDDLGNVAAPAALPSTPPMTVQEQTAILAELGLPAATAANFSSAFKSWLAEQGVSETTATQLEAMAQKLSDPQLDGAERGAIMQVLKDVQLLGAQGANDQELLDAVVLSSAANPAIGAAVSALVKGLGDEALWEAAAEALIAIFLKLNLLDPNNSPETMNRLNDLSSKMRKENIQTAKELNSEAQEKLKAARELARTLSLIGPIITAVMIVLTAVLIALTAGALAVPLLILLAVVVVVVFGSMMATKAAEGHSLKSAALEGLEAAGWAAMAVSLLAMPLGAGMMAGRAAVEAAKQGAKAAAALAAQTSTAAAAKASAQAAVAATQNAIRNVGIYLRSALAEFLRAALRQFVVGPLKAIQDKAAKIAVKAGVSAGTKAGGTAAGQAATNTVAQTSTKSAQASAKSAQASAQAADDAAAETAEQASKSALSQSTSQGNKAFSEVAFKRAQQAIYVLIGVMQVSRASLEAAATQEELEGQRLANEARAYELMSQMYQELVEMTNKAIEAMFAHKNEVFDSVIKMLAQKHGVNMQIMQAFMTR